MPAATAVLRWIATLALTTACATAATPATAAGGVDAPHAAAASAPAGTATTGKFTLIALDTNAIVVAQNNPKLIVIEKSVAWAQAPTSLSDQPELQFKRAQGRTMSFELEFDTSAGGTDVHAAHVVGLVALAMIMDPSPMAPEDKRRPPRVRVADGAGAILFEGVVESVETRYTQFLANGTPVRATCSVMLKEASRATFVRS